MKKLLTLSAMALVTVSAFGQGQVLFNNLDKGVTPNILATVKDGDTGALLDGTVARAALLGGPASAIAADLSGANPTAGTLSMLANPSDGSTWVNFRTGAAAGYVAVGASGARILTDVGYSGTAKLQMVAWTGTATTWSAAFAAALADRTLKVGASAPWTVTTTQSAIDTAFAHNVGLSSFSITPIGVPEPSTMALAGLAGAALLIFRRRK